jgi:hypothetical protein
MAEIRKGHPRGVVTPSDAKELLDLIERGAKIKLYAATGSKEKGVRPEYNSPFLRTIRNAPYLFLNYWDAYAFNQFYAEGIRYSGPRFL